VALYREQRSALAAKEKQREAEIASLSKSKVEMQERAGQLELLLKATVQNIRVPELKPVPIDKDDNEDQGSEISDEEREDFEIVEKEETLEIELDSPQKENIVKILNLLDEIRDPFAGQSMPAMIGLEYLGSLQTI